MLKALELVGFKSFADRTRFDFPDGITVVVGPNGSGKSNVVDAVKWVLGAQSAKALRGADMADCIFKGSAAGGRKPSNSAEVILILDNQLRRLNSDADEVQVSRRVFRSGDGEYAINGQPCRLKDIRDLFRGTGVGVDSYSLIEQGKVDRLLQSSAKERRGIFEEAAGISRFKAKKVEAERRLTRVDQNMLRLSDIVDEVGKRLSILKNQASKAQRYREMTDELRNKRTQLGIIDKSNLILERETAQTNLVQSKSQLETLSTSIAALQQQVSYAESILAEQQHDLDTIQNEYLAVQRDLISAENGRNASLQRVAELTAEQDALKERIETLVERVTVSSEEIEQRQRALQSTEAELEAFMASVLVCERELQLSNESLQSLKQDVENARATLTQHRDAINTHQSKLDALTIHADQANRMIESKRDALLTAHQELASLATEFDNASMRRDAAERTASNALAKKISAAEHLQHLHRELLAKQEAVVVLQGRMHGVTERLNVLEQLEDQFTGAGRGGQQLLRLSRQHRDANAVAAVPFSDSQGWGTIQGLVADIITTELHLAPLIDVALGTLSDAIVLSNGQIIDWINDGSLSIEGRVTLLRLDRLSTRRAGEKIQLDGLRGVIGRADRLTQFEPQFESLVRSLLGTTWFVDSLVTALELSHFRGAGLRFVTAECQLVESDGSITLGSLQTGLGLVSRRSEMQSARTEIAHIEQLITESQAAVAFVQSQLAQAESEVQHRDAESHDASRELTACELRLETIRAQKTKLESTLRECEDYLTEAQVRLTDLEHARIELESRLQELQQVQTASQLNHDSIANQIASKKEQQRIKNAEVIEKRIEHARLEQRIEGMRTTIVQLMHDSDERNKGVELAQVNLNIIGAKIEQSQSNADDFATKIEEAKASQTAIEARKITVTEQLQTQQSELNRIAKALDSERRNADRAQDRLASLNEHCDQCESRITQLIQHYLDEFQIDLNQNDANVASNLDDGEEQPDRAMIEAAVIHLRQEIATAGSVNMEALQELDELQSRYDKLYNHQQDLTNAKSGLIKTLNQIDEDARDLFATTLTAIRTKFQELYRKSFGGGFADIVLENENDPDSGIEIVATPPGKTTLSNSLLSGGEKALTAVALIMAFFQYRPSPFCILDEVDAPFDEANIGRFVTVLKEFLSTTKFIVVTHSKKTMTAANMIYGITMQESGVSRQVSVRFEEVNDQGEIISDSASKAA